MTDKESLNALRDMASETYVFYGAIFRKSQRFTAKDHIGKVAKNWTELNDLFDQVQHRLASNPFDLATPLMSMPARNFTQGAINLSFQCRTMMDMLHEVITNKDGSMEADVLYYHMLQEAMEHEVNAAIALVDNPKAKLPKFSIKDYMPSFVLTRADLVGKNGFVGVTSGRITQLMAREENPFPPPFHRRGREEYWTIDSVESWLKEEKKRKFQ